jgi:hypothetical protein
MAQKRVASRDRKAVDASTLVEGGCDKCASLYSLRKTGQLCETCEFAAAYLEYLRNHDDGTVIVLEQRREVAGIVKSAQH